MFSKEIKQLFIYILYKFILIFGIICIVLGIFGWTFNGCNSMILGFISVAVSFIIKLILVHLFNKDETD